MNILRPYGYGRCVVTLEWFINCAHSYFQRARLLRVPPSSLYILDPIDHTLAPIANNRPIDRTFDARYLPTLNISRAADVWRVGGADVVAATVTLRSNRTRSVPDFRGTLLSAPDPTFKRRRSSSASFAIASSFVELY